MSIPITAHMFQSSPPTAATQVVKKEKDVPRAAHEALVVPRPKSLDLVPSEVREIERRAASVTGALKSLDRQHEAVQDQRFARRCFSSFTVIGLWSRAISWLRWGAPDAPSTPAQRVAQLERSISDNITELKRITERVVLPELAPMREKFRGRTFTREEDTPKALLLVSVPTEKVGKVLSFDSLRITVDTRALGARATCDISKGDGRIVLERKREGEVERLEFAYKRPGKVDVYVNGERRGSMWNDDALDLGDAVLAGRAIPLEKRAKSQQYTVC